MGLTQQHEMEAWLGNDHGLTGEQVADLMRVSDDIHARYPDPDDSEEREAALIAAYQILLNGPEAVDELAVLLRKSRAKESLALAGLRQAAVMLVGQPAGLDVNTQAGFARRAGVDRMAVRNWLGLR